MSYGRVVFHIDDILKEKNISKNQICKDLNIPRTNFNRYCRNDFQRIDTGLVCKLCHYLDIDIGELMTYERPVK